MTEEPVGVAIGRRVRRLRDAGLWTRGELAERAGVSVQAIAKLELGAPHRPRRDTIERLAQALGVRVETLLAGDDEGDDEAPLPRSREECAFIIVGRVVASRDGDERLMMVVRWNVPMTERATYRKQLAQLLGGDYIEEEPSLSPRAAELLVGAV